MGKLVLRAVHKSQITLLICLIKRQGVKKPFEDAVKWIATNIESIYKGNRHIYF